MCSWVIVSVLRGVRLSWAIILDNVVDSSLFILKITKLGGAFMCFCELNLGCLFALC